jgi:hypothetical protein
MALGSTRSCCVLSIFGPGHVTRPDRTFRPVGREPLKSTIVPSDGNVRPGANGAELLAVLEDTAADSLVFDLGNPTVFVGDFDEVFDIKHDNIIGILTVIVNGFLTARDFHVSAVFLPDD